jgi:hypothetical protein
MTTGFKNNSNQTATTQAISSLKPPLYRRQALQAEVWDLESLNAEALRAAGLSAKQAAVALTPPL